MEIRAYLNYFRIKDPLTFWRSTHGREVDILIGDHTAVEIKSKQKISPKEQKGLRALSEECLFRNYYLVSQDQISTKYGNIISLFWEDFLKRLWDGDLF